MARPLRIEYEGAVYHITSRGNAREAVFRDDQDRENILKESHLLEPVACNLDVVLAGSPLPAYAAFKVGHADPIRCRA